MSRALSDLRRHPVAAFVGRAHQDLDAVAEIGVWSMPAAELGETLVELARLKARVAELELRVLAQAEHAGVGAADGATSAAAWWAHQARMTRPEARRLGRLAARLDEFHEPVRDALAAGDLLVDQAAVIVDAVDALPHEIVDVEVAREAQLHLVSLAREYDARTLRVLGRRILEVVAPEVAERHEQQVLERQEEAARAAASFTISDDGHGSCHGRFTLPTLHGEMLRKALTALANPARREQSGEDDPRVRRPLRMGHALMEYVERYPADRLPDAGGCTATVVVTMTLDALLSGLGSAALDTGGQVSAGEARRLAATAGVVPAVLGTASVVLDLGRKARLFTRGQRTALTVRDAGCSVEGCDWPPGMCHAHHDHPWSVGGRTDLANARLLCPRHHRLAHDQRYLRSTTAGNKLVLHRRT